MNVIFDNGTHKAETAGTLREYTFEDGEKEWRDSELNRTLSITQDPEHPEKEIYSAYRTALYAYDLNGNRPTLS